MNTGCAWKRQTAKESVLAEGWMSFISRIMRFLLWVLVLWWGVALLRCAVAWLLRGVANPAEQPTRQVSSHAQADKIGSRKLVRDPVCGVHITEDRALALPEGSGVVHFCSKECRDQYVGSEKKFAAGG
jgi:YHS domain-containing protein